MKTNDLYTSSGYKFFCHEEAMKNLRNGKGQPVVTHIMSTDVCAHSCAFCSVQSRAGDVLPFDTIMSYLDILQRYGLRATILSGGGNPILYKCKVTGKGFNELVDAIHSRGLQIGLISDGMPLKQFPFVRQTPSPQLDHPEAVRIDGTIRESWATVRPETLDKLTWIRISMAGLDHSEREVYVPDIDPTKTTLGFSYVGHDLYIEPADPHHGKVSTPADLITIGAARAALPPTWTFDSRIPELTEQIRHYVEVYHPRYVRLLPNCLEPSLIAERCVKLQSIADAINPSVVFVQQKPPAAPHACYLGYIHPVLNCDGYVYPCDSCVLNEAAGHSFANPWRVCRWDEIGEIYERPVRSLIADPGKTCPGCVFTRSNEILRGVVDGSADITPPSVTPEHVFFV
jgi:hypothetical protein